MKLQAKDLKPGDEIKEGGSWRTVQKTEKIGSIFWIFFNDKLGPVGVREDREYYVRRAKIRKIKKGQVYCKLIIELELVAEKPITDDYAEHEIENYIDYEAEIIGRYAASRGGENLRISNKNFKWRVE